jgi:hypothetical protein
MSQPEIRDFKIMDLSTGKMAAWARWQFPYSLSEDEKAQREREKEQRQKMPEEGTWSEWPQGSIWRIVMRNLEVLRG